MASIPLPALHVNPPTDQGEGIQRMVQMMSMLRQQKAQDALLPGQVQQQQQAIQATGLENQQRQQAIKNQQAQTAAMQEWDGKDMNTLPGLMLKHGATADVVMSTKSSITKQLQEMENLSKDQLANQATVNDRLLGHIDAIKGVTDPTQRGTVAQQQAQQIIQAGLHKNLDPQSAQMVQATAQGQMVPTDDQISIFEKGLTAHNAQIEQAAKAAETREKNAQAGKMETENANLQKFGGMSPAMAESRYLSVQTKLNQGMPVSPDDKAFSAGYEKNKTLVPAFNIKMQNSDGGIGPTGGAAAAGGGSTGAGTGTGAPKDPAAQVPGMLKGSVQAVLDYRSPMPPQGRNNARNNAIRDWVNKIDPTYDETTFPARNKILTEYVKSAGNGPIGAINTALGHLGELNEAAKALDKNDVPLLHSIASKVGAAVGDDAATTYTSILHRVGPEMTSAYVQGGGGQAERGANEEDFAVSKGQKQILSNIGESAKLLRSKMSSLENNWNQTFRPANDNQKFENRFITPQAKATLNAVSAQAPGGTVMMKAPNGQTKAVPADQVDHYKSLGAVPVNQ